MQQHLKMWGRSTSVNVQKVAWVLAELDVGYERIDVGGMYGGLNDPEYVAMNPTQRIPTLLDGEMILWESNVICRYLVDNYGSDVILKGQDPQSRAQADMWMEWFQNNVYAHFIGLFYQEVRLPVSQRDALMRDAALAKLNDAMLLFDEALMGRTFILGDRLSLGDIPTGTSLFRYFTLEINRPRLPNLERYYAQLQKRPHFREAVMVDYSSLRSAD
jgi:glutathione S-transferase